MRGFGVDYQENKKLLKFAVRLHKSIEQFEGNFEFSNLLKMFPNEQRETINNPMNEYMEELIREKIIFKDHRKAEGHYKDLLKAVKQCAPVKFNSGVRRVGCKRLRPACFKEDDFRN